jgi:prepilin-type processing-associated H-X9-DG protein
MMRLNCRRDYRRGATLIEMLVVTGLIALIASLALPAVQAARESARRAWCANQLKQVILAAHSFESARGGFPPAWSGSVANRRIANDSSGHPTLLPYLDQVGIFNSLNFEGPGNRLDNLGVNFTAAAYAVGSFLCPSDPNRRGRGAGVAPNNYRMCLGVGSLSLANGAYSWIEDGVFVYSRSVLPLAEIRDGLSQTLAFSEKPIGSGTGGRFHPFRDYSDHDSLARDPDEWVRECANQPVGPSNLLDAGATWMLAGPVYTGFLAKAPPNDRTPDCGNRGVLGHGLFTARSYHPGGVNAAMADGSVHWFKSSIAVGVWRALGTRNRGDGVVP